MPLTITVHCRHTVDFWCFRLSRAKFSWAWQRVCLAFLSSWCLFPYVVCSCYKLTKGKIGQKYVSVWVFSHALYLFIHRVRSLGKLRGKKISFTTEDPKNLAFYKLWVINSYRSSLWRQQVGSVIIPTSQMKKLRTFMIKCLIQSQTALARERRTSSKTKPLNSQTCVVQQG